jgi:hypothetical protein
LADYFFPQIEIFGDGPEELGGEADQNRLVYSVNSEITGVFTFANDFTAGGPELPFIYPELVHKGLLKSMEEPSNPEQAKEEKKAAPVRMTIFRPPTQVGRGIDGKIWIYKSPVSTDTILGKGNAPDTIINTKCKGCF